MSDGIRRAIAYLKPDLSGEGGEPDIVLSPAHTPVVRSYAPGLLVAYLIDAGTHFEYVHQRDLDREHIDLEELHRLGLENLGQLINERETQVQPYENIFSVVMGGDFEASLLLVDSLWNVHFRDTVEGDYVAAIPARDILAFCDSTSAQGVRELRELIGRVFSSGDHLISDRLYVRRDGTWKPHE